MAVNFAVEGTRTSEYRFLPENITIKPELNGRHDIPDVEGLITDILRNGQIQPVTIRKAENKPVLVAGFSRWRAVSQINKRGLSHVPMQLRCTYVECTEAEAFFRNISENRVRNEVSPIDDAHNIKRLLNVYSLTEEQVAEIYFPTAKTDSELKVATKFVKQRVSLISLSPEAVAAVRGGRVADNAATAIAKLSEEQQRKVIQAHPEGTITRKDVAPAKPAKAAKVVATVPDTELIRRARLITDETEGLLYNEETGPFISITRVALTALFEYLEESAK